MQRLLVPIATKQQEAMARSESAFNAFDSELHTISTKLNGLSAGHATITSKQRKLEEAVTQLQEDFREFTSTTTRAPHQEEDAQSVWRAGLWRREVSGGVDEDGSFKKSQRSQAGA